MLWIILVQFLCRLTFGLAAAMALTPPRLVTSGFYRVHLWVLLGCNTLSLLLLFSHRNDPLVPTWLLACIVLAIVGSYVGSVMWLYEKIPAGMTALILVSLAGGIAAQHLTTFAHGRPIYDPLLMIDTLSSSFLVGVTLAAMFLGHWYLNTPTMQLAPLQRLVWLILLAVTIRAGVAGFGIIAETRLAAGYDFGFLAAVALRWLAGLVGTAVLATMTWYTLKVPNTQSATGILYVGVMFVFLGELTSQLLLRATTYPL